MATGREWHVAILAEPSRNPWDVCHDLMASGLGVASGPVVELAEPDLAQQWLWHPPRRAGLAAAECTGPRPQDGDTYATWRDGQRHDDEAHAQLAAAREVVGDPGAKRRVRIAQLDTGYDPEHATKPRWLRHDLERSFVDPNAATNDATDRSLGWRDIWQGHGTATLALLAGSGSQGTPMGGAAHLEVVPLRVADSVVLFWTSSVARALRYVLDLGKDPATAIDVVTMSMGGVASAAWADAVNALYEAGIVVVCAGGNNWGNLPTRFTVFPARFRRVIAALGVMADGRPFADLPLRKMAGCYGPKPKDSTSLAAYTPNVPWAHMGCPTVVDEDGNGTSAATPQIAAAAALWMQQHRAALARLREPWMRAEATRQALFESAHSVDAARAKCLGRGILRAHDALSLTPARLGKLAAAPRATAALALLRGLGGFGVVVARPSAREAMLDLEVLQLSQRSHAVEELIGEVDPEAPESVSPVLLGRVVAAIADSPDASQALKAAIAVRLAGGARVPVEVAPKAPRRRTLGREAPGEPAPGAAAPPPSASAPRGPSHSFSEASDPPEPTGRSLRIFAFDPAVGRSISTYQIAQTTVRIRREPSLEPGPVGEYLEVVDVDPPSGCAYAPVDLNHPSILAEQGLEPSEGRPQFHQQMVYAVAMRTIEHFERALGRAALWADRQVMVNGAPEYRFVRRLRIYPHALLERNAYYSPEHGALLFGYFHAPDEAGRGVLPGGVVFTCLSQDIVAHETAHALLDGLHPHYKEPSGLDMLAFHEAFADIVALFQHFSLPEALRSELGRAQGDLELAPLLGGLAGQFGQAIGNRGALRSYIAQQDPKTKEWMRREPTPTDYSNATEPHARGAVLVAAVFDAFLQIFRRETEDLRRLATGGTGVLADGALSQDFVGRLCREAATLAERVLGICIRALDYCPPVELSFGEYLRALITADHDLVPDDPYGYRVAFVSAFSARGIYPSEVATLAADALRWQPPEADLSPLVRTLEKAVLPWPPSADRHAAFLRANQAAKAVWSTLVQHPEVMDTLGLLAPEARQVVVGDAKGEVTRPAVHSIRPLRRAGPDGRVRADVILEITQSFRPDAESGVYRGGSTLICDQETLAVRYLIRKRAGSSTRIADQRRFMDGLDRSSPRSSYFELDYRGEHAFAMAHRDG
ncbi:MAG: S8 family serine peptidase [Polyangiaceae bacterium]|nr:S8 family serine peptidase [Polyangiaceae bacterium]